MLVGKSEMGIGQQRIKRMGASLRNLFGSDKPAPSAAPSTAPNSRLQLREQLSEIGKAFGEVVVDLTNSSRSLLPGRRTALIQQLMAPPRKSTPVGQALATLDSRYQRFIVEQIDTRLGRTRSQQIEAMATGEVAIELSPYEQKRNRDLASAVVLLGTAVTGATLLPALWPISFGLGLYLTWDIFVMGWQSLTKEHRLTVPAMATLGWGGLLVSGYFVPVGLSMILYFFGEKLTLITRDRSRKNLNNMFGLHARKAWVLIDGQEVELPIEQVDIGAIIVVMAGQVIPVDGVVVEGVATIDQHMLTGEAQPIERMVGEPVLAATVVLAGKLHIQVEKAGEATVAAQIGSILQKTVGQRMSVASRGAQLADRTVLPILLTGIGAGFLISNQALLIIINSSLGAGTRMTSSLSMLNYLNIAARQRILIKDGRSMETLHKVNTIVFDKTGTLTLEQPHVAQIHPCAGLDEATILTYAAAAEHRQSHPVAQAILAAAAERGLVLPTIEQSRYEVGYGIRVQIGDLLIRVGSVRYMTMEGISIPAAMAAVEQSSAAQGHSIVMVAVDEQLAGAIELQPTIRPEAAAVVQAMRAQHVDICIISGDQEAPTRKLADTLGITQYFANTLPENKAAIVRQLQEQGRTVCFVGDGINDAVALKTANVSISLRGATSIATDTAQIVLMDQTLAQLPYLFTMGQEFHLNQNACLAANIVPGAIMISGALLSVVTVTSAPFISFSGMLAGLGIAMLPLRLHQKELSAEMSINTKNADELRA